MVPRREEMSVPPTRSPPRVFAVGDIHGWDDAFGTLLDAIDLCHDDLLIVLGDFVNGGEQSRQVLERLSVLKRLFQDQSGHLAPILGNHDQLMREAHLPGGSDELIRWSKGFGKATALSYGGETIPESHLDLLHGANDYFTHENDIFVHANLRRDLPLVDQPAQWLRWEQTVPGQIRYREDKRVICGHTYAGEQPLAWPGWVMLDTGAGYRRDGWLTCLETVSNQYIQANQAGEIRNWQPLEVLSRSAFRK